MADALCGDPPRHRRAAWILHAGHRLASSDEWTPARRPLWGSELPRVFAGKVSTASGLQRSPRRGRDEGDGAMDETCDHLWRMLRFGSHHHACERRDHGLRGGPRIEGRECLAGHCLPPAALDPTRPRRTHGVQRLPHDGVLTAELQCQGAHTPPAVRCPGSPASAHARHVHTPAGSAPVGGRLPACPPPRGPGCVTRPWRARPGPTPASRERKARSCPGGRRPAALVHPHRRTAAGVPGDSGAQCNFWAPSKNGVAGMP